MKKNILIIALCMALVVLFASCTTFTVKNAAYGNFKGKSLGDFEVTVVSYELLGTSGGAHIVGGKEWKGTDLINTAINAKIKELGGSAAINVEIQENIDVVQALLCGVTGRIYAPETILIKGTVIK